MTPEEQAAAAAVTSNEASGTNASANQPGIFASILKTGLTGVASNMFIGIGVDSVMGEAASAKAIPASGPPNESVPDNILGDAPKPDAAGEIIAGPAEGGGLLDRPMMGGLADQAASQSLQINYGGGNAPNVSVPTEGEGMLSVNGHNFNVIEYLPGADMVKSATGSLQAGDAMSMLTQTILREGKSKDEDQELADRLTGNKLAQKPAGLSDEPIKRRFLRDELRQLEKDQSALTDKEKAAARTAQLSGTSGTGGIEVTGSQLASDEKIKIAAENGTSANRAEASDNLGNDHSPKSHNEQYFRALREQEEKSADDWSIKRSPM